MAEQKLHPPKSHLEVEGQDTPFKDAKLFPGGARAWDWNETGTNHELGIQPADVEELLEHGVTTVILGKGFYERLQVHPETLRELEERNISVHVEQTEEAVRRYNELSNREKEEHSSTQPASTVRSYSFSSPDPKTHANVMVPGELIRWKTEEQRGEIIESGEHRPVTCG